MIVKDGGLGVARVARQAGSGTMGGFELLPLARVALCLHPLFR